MKADKPYSNDWLVGGSLSVPLSISFVLFTAFWSHGSAALPVGIAVMLLLVESTNESRAIAIAANI